MTQKEALQILKMGYNVFLTGPPGSGKTFLLNEYINYLKKHHRSVAVTAATGIAATHMNGTTVHSWSGLGIKKDISKYEINFLLKKSYLKKRFRKTNVLIIDEVSMLNADQFGALDKICQAFKKSSAPFGKMQVVCSGDFFQLPPVERKGEAKFVFEADVWKEMDIKICYLEEQHRHEDDNLFALLNYIRVAAVAKSKELLASIKYLGEKMPVLPTKLYTHNADVDAINSRELGRIGGREFIYRMSLKGNKNIAAVLSKSCLAPERLVLKRGAEVMFVKNNFEKGYVNGTRGRVVDFDENRLPVVKTFSGRKVVAAPATWMIEEDGFIKAEISQIPLRLAWAITVHKSQGMNLDAAEMDLSKCFVAGMGYVALSRLRSLAGLKLVGINDLAFRVDERVLNVDKEFREISRKIVQYFKKASCEERKERQRRFFNSLPKVKGGVLEMARKEPRVSTSLKTRIFISRKASLPVIARERGLSEKTILGHLEKLAADGREIDIEYLKPDKERFEKIKEAFLKSRDVKLKPTREILGNGFSYEEIRLARLILRQEGFFGN